MQSLKKNPGFPPALITKHFWFDCITQKNFSLHMVSVISCWVEMQLQLLNPIPLGARGGGGGLLVSAPTLNSSQFHFGLSDFFHFLFLFI